MQFLHSQLRLSAALLCENSTLRRKSTTLLVVVQDRSNHVSYLQVQPYDLSSSNTHLPLFVAPEIVTPKETKARNLLVSAVLQSNAPSSATKSQA
jgi:hypothetical protein